MNRKTEMKKENYKISNTYKTKYEYKKVYKQSINKKLQNLDKKFILNKNKLSNHLILTLFYYILILIFFPISLSNNFGLIILNKDQEITVVTEGEGTIQILYSSFYPNPDSILINGQPNENLQSKQITVVGLENNITLKWKNKLTSCKCMFQQLDRIKAIDLSKFDSSEVTTLNGMFYESTNIKQINLNNFNTSLVTEMNFMFGRCTSLTSLDLRSFNTNKVQNMGAMFKECHSLTSLDLSNFDTSLVTDISYMFSFCYSLKYLNVKSFNTSLVDNMLFLFHSCKSLTSLDISNFNISLIQNTQSMFENCFSLTSLYLKNFNTKNVVDMSRMFYNCSSLKSLDLISFDTSSLTNLDLLIDNCLSLEIINFMSFNEKKNCSAKIFITKSDNLIYCLDEEKNPTIKKYLELKNVKSDCTDICLLNPKKTYFENDKCIFCENDVCKYENNDICCDNCPDGYDCKSIFIETEKIIDTTEITKMTEITEMIELTEMTEMTEILEEKNCSTKDYFQKKCELDTKTSTDQDNIINKIRNDIQYHNIEDLLKNLTEGKTQDLLIKDNNTLYQVTSSENQNNGKYEDISTIKLGKCEEKLKEEYKIKNKTLIIFKIEHSVPGLLIPVISYEIYHPDTKEKLSLECCKDLLVNLDIPVSIDEEDLIKYDPNSEYYTDECYPYTTDNGTDIIINDRIDEYNDNNLSLCEKNCSFNGYDNKTKKALCECEIKSKIDSISEIIETQDLLLSNNGVKDNSTLNIVTMKCTYTLFTKDGIIKNIGSYILIFIVLQFAISIIIFFKFGFFLFEQDINKVLSQKKNNKKTEKLHTIKPKKIKKKNKKLKKHTKMYPPKKKKKPKTINEKNTSIDIYKINNSKAKIEIKNSNEIIENKSIIKNIKNNSLNSTEEFHNLNDYELNTLSYKEALDIDKRTFLQYYLSLIRTKHMFIFAFFPLVDYNLRIIKICLFFLTFMIYYLMNTLLFTKSIIHKIYEDEGVYNFNYLFPLVIGSFFISYIVSNLVKYLSLSERFIIEVKYQKTYNDSLEKADKVKKSFIIKYICFFVISMLFIILFWYYLSSFCAVYQNTQIYLIENTLISFGISLLFPFIINLIPVIMRMISLSNKDRQLLYRISSIIQFI